MTEAKRNHRLLAIMDDIRDKNVLHAIATEEHPVLTLARRFMEEDLSAVLEDTANTVDPSVVRAALAVAEGWALSGLSLTFQPRTGQA